MKTSGWAMTKDDWPILPAQFRHGSAFMTAVSERQAPCLAGQAVFSASLNSRLARWRAEGMCGDCHALELCARAMEGLPGVWCGTWHDGSANQRGVVTMRPSHGEVLRSICKQMLGLRGAAAVKAAAAYAPGVDKLLLESGELRPGLTWREETSCITYEFLGLHLASLGRAPRLSMYRAIYGEDGENASAYTTCHSETCLAPWHLFFITGVSAHQVSRVLYLSWVEQIEATSMYAEVGVTATEARRLLHISHNLRVLGGKIPASTEANVSKLLRDVELPESSPLLKAAARITSAADELRVGTIHELAGM